MAIVTLRIDLAKDVFALHAWRHGQGVLVRRNVPRGGLPEFIESPPPRLSEAGIAWEVAQICLQV